MEGELNFVHLQADVSRLPLADNSADALLDKIYQGDALEVLRTLPDGLVHTCVTSPPYWGLRDYGVEGQLGLEATPEEYVERLVEVFREVRRVLRDDGTMWVVLGDSYCSTAPGTRNAPQPKGSATAADAWANMRPATPPGLKPKDLVGIPWRVAFALQADGWWLRAENIWSKPNPMPASMTDRTTRSHETIFHLSKSATYYYDADAIKVKVSRKWDESNGGNLKVGGKRKVGEEKEHRHGGGYPKCEGTRNKRSVWTIALTPCPDAHFAVFPPALIRPCVLAGCPQGGVVLDPFFGRGTTGRVALEYGRHFVGIELNKEYVKMAERYLVPFRQQAVMV